MVFSIVGGFGKLAEHMVAERRDGRHLLIGEKGGRCRGVGCAIILYGGGPGIAYIFLPAQHPNHLKESCRRPVVIRFYRPVPIPGLFRH